MAQIDLLQKVANAIKTAKHTTAFSGAGISVESGIPPFRGHDGLWSKYDPTVLDLNYFHAKPKEAWAVIRELFYDFFGKAQPNAAHNVLARMEKEGLLQAVITQNIDNLHQEAGSRIVYEFHGTAQTLVCTKTRKRYPASSVDLSVIPPLSETGAVLKPDFIFFGETIPQLAFKKSVEEAEKADVFIIIGTTGEVMPASMIPQKAKLNGATIVEINTEPSLFTRSITNVFLKGKATEVMSELEKLLFAETG